MTIECSYSNPVELGDNNDWEFTSLTCETSYELILPQTEGGFTYGETLIATLLFIFLAIFVFSGIIKAVKGVKIMRQ